jgi:hypothetical protein
MPRAAVSRVMYLRANLISSCGLFPASSCKGSVIPRVHTELGGDWWVEREVSLSELLAMWDAPEPLEMLLLSEKERRSLLKFSKVPLKVMEHVIDSLHSMWSRDAEMLAQKQSVNRVTKAAAASSAIAREVLEQRSPVWIEKDSCPDAMEKSAENPEENPAERARQEVLNRLKLEMHEGSDRNTKAAKNDKAKAPTYMWDRWTLPYCNVVCQRGGEPARHLDWRRSFSRLAMLRFWKRSFLRGFARYQKNESRSSHLADHVLEAA